jgi:hypothetical protein
LINKIFRFRFLGVLLLVTMMSYCLLAAPVMATDSYPYSSGNIVVSSALDYLRGQQETDGKIGDFATSAWVVMAIAAAGEDPADWQVGSNPSIVDYLSVNAGDASQPNDYSRMILAIAAAGEDPADFGGVDFVSLLEAAYDGNQIGDSSLLNDDFWGVMALVSAGLDPAISDALQDSVSYILTNQNDDGGWSWGVGFDSDVDDTAAAVMALISAGESPSSTAITEALAYIKSTQMDNGGFESWGSTTNSATDAWGIDSIAAVGQNPTSAAWENTSGYNPVDDLLAFQNADGSFNWTDASPTNKELMTSYAINALSGIPYTVAVLPPQEPEDGVSIDVRVEGQSGTIWSGEVTVSESTIIDDEGNPHEFDVPTAVGALDEAAQAGDFDYVVQNTAYGLYIYSINGEEPAGLAGWMYRVDYCSPMVGAADFVLDETSPPNPPHQEVLFAYAEWGQAPLKVEVDDTTPGVGDAFTVTVTQYDDDTGTWSPAADATVHADQNYTTGQDGMAVVTINDDLTLAVYAEKDGCIRSNRVIVTVGEGSAQPGDSKSIGMAADIIPAISFTVNPSSINFGRLGPRDTSAPQDILVSNNGAWNLRITAAVTDSAQNLYVHGLKLDDINWNSFSIDVPENEAKECMATLTVPETYDGTGLQNGILIFWAEEAS